MSSGSALEIRDSLDRPLRDLRISVTDRCNFRCSYCLPRSKTSEATFLPRSEIMSFEEIARLARCFVATGVQKIRLTGGEPLLRKGLATLVEMLASLEVDLALTTNGVLLPALARDLKQAGLNRVTVSLDAMDADVFQAMCDAPTFSPADVLRGIEAAEAAGFDSVKINCVVRRGQNENQVEKVARHFAGTKHIVRFIEFMDVGTRNAWHQTDVVSAREIQTLLSAVDDLIALPPNYRGEVARRFGFTQGGGEVGIIASVTEPFCGDCTRARLSADGRLFACLFAQTGVDLRQTLRSGVDDAAVGEQIRAWWGARSDRYSDSRVRDDASTRGRRLPVVSPRVEMSFIGG